MQNSLSSVKTDVKAFRKGGDRVYFYRYQNMMKLLLNTCKNTFGKNGDCAKIAVAVKTVDNSEQLSLVVENYVSCDSDGYSMIVVM